MNAYQERQKVREEAQHANQVQMLMAKYDSKVGEGNMEHTSPMYRVMLDVYKDVVDNFEVYDNQKVKSSQSAVLSYVGKEAVANMVAESVVMGAARKETRQDIVQKISDTLGDVAIEVALMNSEDKRVVKTTKTTLSSKNTATQIKRALEMLADRAQIDVEDTQEMRKLAAYLFTKATSRVNVFETVDADTDEDASMVNSPMKALTFTEQALKKFKGLAKDIAENAPKYFPLVTAPRDWTSVTDGGYYTDGFSFPLVKCKGSRVEVAEYYEKLNNYSEFQNFVDAVNEAQRTAFKVNKKALALVNKAVKAKGGMLGLASTIADRKAKTESAKKDEKAREGKARADKAAIAMASSVKDENEIYFVYQADFRGRIYNVCSDLSTQGSDLTKGLLTFAKGKALGTDGYYWLSIHAANAYGAEVDGVALDKQSFEYRYNWVQENSELFQIVAKGDIKDARFHEIMSECENPIMFYAAALEIAKLIGKSDLQRSRFVSYIPVGMDGSCNGQQWAAGFLRSRLLAENVNMHALTPSDRPNDLYSAVRDAAITFAESNNYTFLAELASSEHYKVDEADVKILVDSLIGAPAGKQRKLFKRPTMTEAYAVTKLGQREMLWIDWRKVREELNLQVSERTYKAVYGLLLDKGLEAACMASRDSMDFFKSCARAMGDKTIYVTNPIGFIMKQSYKVEKEATINSKVLGKTVSMKIKIRTDEVNVKRQQSAIAPNVTHSHDSAHMLMTVLKMKGQDMSWMLIHDDYATHACDVAKMVRTIRETFVEIHKQNRLEALKDEIIAQGGDAAKIGIKRDGNFVADPISLHDDFDLNEVLNATYFFA